MSWKSLKTSLVSNVPCDGIYSRSSVINSFKWKRFSWLRGFYKIVYEMSENTNTNFKCSSLATILVSFYYMVFCFNAFAFYMESMSWTQAEYWTLLVFHLVNKFQFLLNWQWFYYGLLIHSFGLFIFSKLLADVLTR